MNLVVCSPLSIRRPAGTPYSLHVHGYGYVVIANPADWNLTVAVLRLASCACL